MIYVILGIIIPIFIIVGLWSMGWKLTKKHIAISILLLIVGTTLGTAASSVAVIPAGTVGVHDLFGSVSASELPAGLRTKHPFAHIETMSIKTHEIKETSEVPSKEGLIVRLDISILFKIQPNKADEIYKKIGKWYWDVVITPPLRSVIRETTAKFEVKALYTTSRINITVDIFETLSPILEERGIILEKVLLRDLGLPIKITEAIELKLTAEQEIEQKRFEVDREKEEANRKREEAQGIADANRIISESLTTAYLTWYWIENLDTHNSVLYVPVGSGGMPIFKEVDTLYGNVTR